jgi:hypothetical protein
MTDASVEDYPDTGYTMSAEAFAAVETPLAWSAVKPEPHPDEPPQHDWMRVLKLASAIAAVALGVVAVVAVLLNPPSHAQSTTVTETVTPTQIKDADPGPDPPTTLVIPTIMADHETQDGEFLQLVQRGGRIQILNDNPANVVRWGHWICARKRATGESSPQIAYEIYAAPGDNHGMTPELYEIEVDAAITAYCPELG